MKRLNLIRLYYLLLSRVHPGWASPSSSGRSPLREGHFSQLVLTSSHNSGKQGWECIASASSSAFHLHCLNNPSDGKRSTHVRFCIPLTVVFVGFVSNTCAEADLSFGLSHICVSHVLHTALTSTRKLFFLLSLRVSFSESGDLLFSNVPAYFITD